jgi:hypothetical protein
MNQEGDAGKENRAPDDRDSHQTAARQRIRSAVDQVDRDHEEQRHEDRFPYPI